MPSNNDKCLFELVALGFVINLDIISLGIAICIILYLINYFYKDFSHCLPLLIHMAYAWFKSIGILSVTECILVMVM